MKKENFSDIVLGFMGLGSRWQTLCLRKRQGRWRNVSSVISGRKTGHPWMYAVRRWPCEVPGRAVRLITFAHLGPVRDLWWFRVTMPCLRW